MFSCQRSINTSKTVCHVVTPIYWSPSCLSALQTPMTVIILSTFSFNFTSVLVWKTGYNTLIRQGQRRKKLSVKVIQTLSACDGLWLWVVWWYFDFFGVVMLCSDMESVLGSMGVELPNVSSDSEFEAALPLRLLGFLAAFLPFMVVKNQTKTEKGLVLRLHCDLAKTTTFQWWAGRLPFWQCIQCL